MKRPEKDPHRNVPRPGPRYKDPPEQHKAIAVVNPAGRVVRVPEDCNAAQLARDRRDGWRLAAPTDSAASKKHRKPPKGVDVINALGRRVNVTDPQIIAAARAGAHGWKLAPKEGEKKSKPSASRKRAKKRPAATTQSTK